MTFAGDRIVSNRATASAGHEIDADGLVVSPGFIDLQINGGFGHDFAVDPAALWMVGALLPRHGVTGFLPTIVSSPIGRYGDAITALADRPNGYRGAEPLGLHFEGPMLSPRRPGAHRPEHLAAPAPAIIEGWSRERGVALVTLAPELVAAHEIIATLEQRGVTVSAGHTAADAHTGRAAFDQGVTMVTHLFNAMEPMQHRAPGLAGVALVDDRVSVGVIVDGVHVDPVMVALIWRAKGPDRVVLVTDAVAAMGLEPGRHRLGEVMVIADGLSVRTENGTLAGSVLTMDAAVRNTVDQTGADPGDVVAAASVNPARLIGCADRGRLDPGAMADIILLDDRLEVVMAICSGCPAYVTEQARSRMGSGLKGWLGEE
ncbi:MAG: N-acetylglucosamine-6-phosphate deacetylase [Acidimicrobiia bacterium]|nr:N-acetylglucosamine-6-phosphate deacetylase [Acidimicrobiia bacterium]